MKNWMIGLGLLALSGCSGSQVSAWLQGNGVSVAKADKIGTIASNALADGTLFCKFADVLAVVPSVNVINAGADKVSDACKFASIIQAGVQVQMAAGVPVPPPATPTAVPIATVPPATVVAVQKSVPTS